MGVDLIALAAVMFYDATPLQFESELKGGDRFKGFSKDGKPHRVQVVFALLAAPEGLPIGSLRCIADGESRLTA